MPEQKQPGKSSGLLSFILAILALVFAFKAISAPPFIFPAMLSIFFSCVVRSYCRGIVTESLSIIRLIGAFALAWFFAEETGRALGLPGILATIVGFYPVFLVSFLIFGKLIDLISSNAEPSMPSKLLGAFVGGFEGLILAWALLLTVFALPNSKLNDFYPQFFSRFTSPVEKMLAPVLPDQANNAVQAMKTVQKLAKGIDPAKVDRVALQEVVGPLTAIPEVAALREDASFHELVNKRDFKALINNPAVRKLLESKELQGKLMSLDWKKLERAISPGN